MEKYKLCPICELNYITDDEDICSLCRNSGLEESLVDEIEKDEQEKQTRLFNSKDKNEEYKNFIAYRYNIPNKR